MFRQICILVALNFRRWKRSPQIWIAFGLGFIACFLLTDKSVQFAIEHETILQILEPFIWTFGDAKSIMLISLCLLLLFSDIPNLSAELPFYLVRTTRRRWMLAQIIYLVIATFIFTTFILISSCILCQQYAFTANQWSETAAILGYSGIGNKIAVPSFVKVLELTYPYPCTIQIFLLILGYSTVLSSLIFLGNLFRERLGIILGIIFSGFGYFLSKDVISGWFHLSNDQGSIANILLGWLSPLNHATYYMHSFGYDNLPKLSASHFIFTIASIIILSVSFFTSKRYAFHFTGTEQ